MAPGTSSAEEEPPRNALGPQTAPQAGDGVSAQKTTSGKGLRNITKTGTFVTSSSSRAFKVTLSQLGKRPPLKGDKAARAFASAAQICLLRHRIATRTLQLLDGHTLPRWDWVSHLRATYTINLFRAAHLILTGVIFYHHFFIKLTQKENAVPEGAPNWRWKRFVPAVEFGTMHAILLQLALIPLTMCRFSLAYLATTPLSYIIPFEHIVDFHIFLGYVFGSFMVLTVTLFLTFFGKVCADFKAGLDPADTCKNFTSEIMITGYCILFCTLVVMISSFFRKKLKFEWFYALHHMALVMMILAVVHTMDDEFREGTKVGKNRSQAFKWFTTSLVIYIGDRLWQHLSAHRDVHVTSLAVATDGSVLILKLKRPDSFTFVAGQHAFIQIPAIDLTYHPFSIGSAPSNRELTFIMEIQKPGSWTDRLAKMNEGSVALDDMKVNIMGGFGTPVAGKLHYSEIVAIGTGTGVVPMISLMLEHAHRLRLVQKTALQVAADSNLGKKKPLPLGICLMQTLTRWKLMQKEGLESPHIREVVHTARWVRVHRLVGLIASFWPLFELYVLATTLSFAGLPDKAPAVRSQADQLRIATLVSVSVYAALRVVMLLTPQKFLSTRIPNVVASFDALLLVLAALLLAFWWDDELVWLKPTLGQQALRSILSLWRIVTLWEGSPANHRFRNLATANKLVGVSKFTLVWSCNSANLVAGYLPVFDHVVATLAKQLDCTPEALQSCMDIRVHCTDKDEERLTQLRDGMESSKHGGSFIRFGRADLNGAVKGAMERQLISGLNGNGASHTLVTFCGSRPVARLLRHSVDVASGVADSLGLNQHLISFREEFYGVGK